MVDSKSLETQGAELPAIIQNIIQAKSFIIYLQNTLTKNARMLKPSNKIFI